jgi:aspartate/glutamate racemase
MLVGARNASVPLFDTTAIHAAAAAEMALAAEGLATPWAHMR